jgi:ribosomal-protein-alanine N-acetyltransferase
MESANNAHGIRVANSADFGSINQLLQSTEYLHLHADWRLPVDWIGSPGFLLNVAKNGRPDACLIATPDPLPAAWIRLAAFASSATINTVFEPLLAQAEAVLRGQGVNRLAWLSSAEWTDTLLPTTGFCKIEEIETYTTTDLVTPSGALPRIHIRPAKLDDFPVLAELEVDAFDPLWRHSADALRRGWQQAIQFDIAEWQGRVVGFQYSTRSHARNVHLVRITVHPDMQGKGIGTALLTQAIQSFKRSGIRSVSLNTQIGNLPSQTLYHKFGFRPTGQRYPIWAKTL